MKKARPLNFGERMQALRWAKKQLAKEKALTDEMFTPIDPLDRQVASYLTHKPLEVTTPVPNPDQKIEVTVSTAMDRAIQRLRDQASKG